MHWPKHILEPTGIVVGPWAWRITALLGPEATRVRACPSLVVATPEDDESVLTEAAGQLGDWPILLGVREPEFTRQLAEVIGKRIAALRRSRVEAVVLWHDDPLELKGGGALQILFDLRAAGVIRHVGLAHHDAAALEWLARKTAARVLVMPYSLDNQAAAFTALESARQFGMACIACPAVNEPASAAGLAFALGQSHRALPVLDRFPEPAVTPMSQAELDAAWQAYRAGHQPPEALSAAPPDGV